MKDVTYKDAVGRLFYVRVPDGAKEPSYKMGIRLGPPDLAPLGLPVSVEVRLNNELYYRKLMTWNDAKTRRMDILGALQSSLKVDVEKVIELFKDNPTEPT